MPTSKTPLMIIGLTGSIGMGKSTVAKILQEMGFPIYSADNAVHALLKKKGRAVGPVSRLVPEALRGGAIDRKRLGQAVFGQPLKLQKLERIIHPLIRSAERAFLKKARASGACAAILEIPLLFETGAESRCHITFCVTAPTSVQKARVLSRPEMTADRLKAILTRQMPDKEKRRRADFVIQTGNGLEATYKRLEKVLNRLDLLA